MCAALAVANVAVSGEKLIRPSPRAQTVPLPLPHSPLRRGIRALDALRQGGFEEAVGYSTSLRAVKSWRRRWRRTRGLPVSSTSKLLREGLQLALSLEVDHDNSGAMAEIVTREVQGLAVMRLHPETHLQHGLVAIVAG